MVVSAISKNAQIHQIFIRTRRARQPAEGRLARRWPKATGVGAAAFSKMLDVLGCMVFGDALACMKNQNGKPLSWRRKFGIWSPSTRYDV